MSSKFLAAGLVTLATAAVATAQPASQELSCELEPLATDFSASSPVLIALHLRNESQSQLLIPQPDLGGSVHLTVQDQVTAGFLEFLPLSGRCNSGGEAIRLAPGEVTTTVLHVASAFPLALDTMYLLKAKYTVRPVKLVEYDGTDVELVDPNWLGELTSAALPFRLTARSQSDREARELCLDPWGRWLLLGEAASRLGAEHPETEAAWFVRAQVSLNRSDSARSAASRIAQIPYRAVRRWAASEAVARAAQRCETAVVAAVRAQLEQEPPDHWLARELRNFDRHCAGE